MEKGEIYKSNNTGMIVKFISDNGQGRFSGIVLDNGYNQFYKKGDKASGLTSSVFKPYSHALIEETYERAIRVWGIRSQLEMLQEESTELALAVRKYIRFNTNKTKHDVYEEIADVEIMIEQFKLIHKDSQSKIDSIKKHKIDRLDKRLDDLTD